MRSCPDRGKHDILDLRCRKKRVNHILIIYGVMKKDIAFPEKMKKNGTGIEVVSTDGTHS